MLDEDLPIDNDFQAKASRACFLVGAFMYHWALVEGQLNTSIEKLLSLGTLEGVVVAANLQVRSKVHIVTTMVDLKAAKDDDWKAVARKDLLAIGTMADKRNTVAHNVFGPGDSGSGVAFLTVKAKGKLQFPNTHWSEADFFAAFAEMTRLRKRLEEIMAEVLPVKQTLLRHMIGGSRLTPPPAFPTVLNPLPQGLLGSQPPNPQEGSESDQTPEK